MKIYDTLTSMTSLFESTVVHSRDETAYAPAQQIVMVRSKDSVTLYTKSRTKRSSVDKKTQQTKQWSYWETRSLIRVTAKFNKAKKEFRLNGFRQDTPLGPLFNTGIGIDRVLMTLDLDVRVVFTETVADLWDEVTDRKNQRRYLSVDTQALSPEGYTIANDKAAEPSCPIISLTLLAFPALAEMKTFTNDGTSTAETVPIRSHWGRTHTALDSILRKNEKLRHAFRQSSIEDFINFYFPKSDLDTPEKRANVLRFVENVHQLNWEILHYVSYVPFETLFSLLDIEEFSKFAKPTRSTDILNTQVLLKYMPKERRAQYLKDQIVLSARYESSRMRSTYIGQDTEQLLRQQGVPKEHLIEIATAVADLSREHKAKYDELENKSQFQPIHTTYTALTAWHEQKAEELFKSAEKELPFSDILSYWVSKYGDDAAYDETRDTIFFGESNSSLTFSGAECLLTLWDNTNTMKYALEAISSDGVEHSFFSKVVQTPRKGPVGFGQTRFTRESGLVILRRMTTAIETQLRKYNTEPTPEIRARYLNWGVSSYKNQRKACRVIRYTKNQQDFDTLMKVEDLRLHQIPTYLTLPGSWFSEISTESHTNDNEPVDWIF